MLLKLCLEKSISKFQFINYAFIYEPPNGTVQSHVESTKIMERNIQRPNSEATGER